MRRRAKVITMPAACADVAAYTVEVLYRMGGSTHRKAMPWKRAATTEAIAEWVQEYEDRVAAGYSPKGFDVPPSPHCVRVMRNGRVVAEWMRHIARAV